MGCNCSCAKNETLSEMVAEPEYPPDINENLNNLNNINIDIKEKEKENKSERTSIQSQLYLYNADEGKIKDKEKEKPILLEKLSQKGTFQEKNITQIIEEQNPEANKIELPNEIN